MFSKTSSAPPRPLKRDTREDWEMLSRRRSKHVSPPFWYNLSTVRTLWENTSSKVRGPGHSSLSGSKSWLERQMFTCLTTHNLQRWINQVISYHACCSTDSTSISQVSVVIQKLHTCSKYVQNKHGSYSVVVRFFFASMAKIVANYRSPNARHSGVSTRSRSLLLHMWPNQSCSGCSYNCAQGTTWTETGTY